MLKIFKMPFISSSRKLIIICVGRKRGGEKKSLIFLDYSSFLKNMQSCSSELKYVLI